MSEPRIPFRDTWPADVSIRDDAALGRALRRVMTSLPLTPGDPVASTVSLEGGLLLHDQPRVGAWRSDTAETFASGPTYADALNALADALESRTE